MNEYMTDEELLELISDIEECNLVKAPPEIEEKVFDKIDKKKQIIEYKRFRNRVILAVAAAVIIISIPFEMIVDVPDFTGSHYVSDLLHRGDK